MNESGKKTPGTVFIALSGKKQVGKDTAATMMVELLTEEGRTVGVTAFAEVLKDVAIDVLGLPRALVYGTNEDKETITHIMWDNLPLKIRKHYAVDTVEDSVVIGYLWPAPRVGPMTIREVLQVLGTDIFRSMLEEDVWANSPFRRDWSNYNVVLITDCRFPNEVRVTEERGGMVIRLERDTGFQDKHASETALDDVEFTTLYDNNGSLNDLRAFLQNTLTTIGLL